MTIFIILVMIVISFVSIIFLFIEKDYYIHMAQLSNYRHFEYFNWFNKGENRKKFLKKGIFLVFLVIFILLNILILKFGLIKNFEINSIKIFNQLNLAELLIFLFSIFINVIILYLIAEKRKKVKKPLVYTKRAIRLKILSTFIYLIFLFVIFLVFKNNTAIFVGKFDNIRSTQFYDLIKISLFINIYSFFNILIFYKNSFIVLLSLFMIYPFEEKINQRFFVMAKNKIEKLKDNGLIVVGITGSYGKTSTKFYIKAVLEKKYNLLASKLSYNTPMGLSKTINEELESNHQIFISEMGARYKNDISTLTELCKPDIGVLTAIGPVHLETFKTQENIIEEKWKIVTASRFSIVNIDNDFIYKKIAEIKSNLKYKDIYLIDKTIEEKNFVRKNFENKKYIFTYGFQKERNPYFLIDEMNFVGEKTYFSIIISNKGKFDFETKLLGKHSVQNLAAAIGIGFLLDVEPTLIKEAILQIEPVEHRLALIKVNENLTIIDDAFNSNPDSAKAAISVLKEFKDRKKIIVTPGFIELGDFQYQKNYEFGKLISENVDFAIFVGKTNKDSLIKGFTTNSNNNNFMYVENLEEAKKVFPKLIDRKSVILFENDLPDNYES